MVCINCGAQYDQWQHVDREKFPFAPADNQLCIGCNESAWLEWEKMHSEEIQKIKALELEGHHPHCACRIVWGDGECECDMIKAGYDPYAWMKREV